MSYRARRSFLKRHLRINLGLKFNRKDNENFNYFTEKYLGGDGILFLRLIEKNTNPAIAGKEPRGERHDSLIYLFQVNLSE